MKPFFALEGNAVNIDDYLRATKRNIYTLNPNYKEDDIILKLLSQVASNINPAIKIKPIFSTTIFPEIVHINESIYLLWDMHFWDIFRTILLTNFLLYETESTETPESTSSSKVLDYAADQYRIIFLDVLINRLRRHPKVAFRLAQEQFFYRELAKRDPEPFVHSFSHESSQEIYNTILLAKLYVFLHEIHHEYLKSDEQYRLNAIELQQEVANIMMGSIDFSKTSLDSNTIDALNMKAYRDKANLEESTCDLCAFKLAYKYVAMIMPNLDTQKVIKWLYNAFATSIYFVEISNHLELFWNKSISCLQNHYLGANLALDDIYSEIKPNYAKMQNRMTFLMFAIYSDLFHMGISVSKSLFSKGDKMARYISKFVQSFFDLKFLALIHHDAQNLKTKKDSPNFFVNL